MYQSTLLINVGDNPDRPRPGRLWLRNLYHVHQRLCMAFPSESQKSDDVDFLKPFNPEEFGNGHVRVTRTADSGFLFRIDPKLVGRAVILVQSAIKPYWEYAFRNADYLLAAPPEVKVIDPCYKEGQYLRFRLVANPTRKIDTKSGPNGERNNGNRVPVANDRLFEWLYRRAESMGFTFDLKDVAFQTSYTYFKKPEKNQNEKSKKNSEEKGRLRSVRFDGFLTVTDSDVFRNTLSKGIGTAKAFGFGLLSVAPVHS